VEARLPKGQDIRIMLDMFVLGQGIKTGIYRVCDELFPRLALRRGFIPRYLPPENPRFYRAAREYIEERKLPGLFFDDRKDAPTDTDVLFLPFNPASPAWEESANVVKAIVIYDLIAILREDLATFEATNVVRSIVNSITPDMVVFTISEHTKKDLLAYRPDLSASQVTVIPLAAPLQYAPCEDMRQRALMREKYGIPPGVPYILSLATLEVRKNMEQVVRAFTLLCDAWPDTDCRLVLSGMKGWKVNKLEESLSQAGACRDKIGVTGFVDEEDMPALYSDAACFAYMSRYEGFGLPPLEAMACGAPVITSNTSSLPEVVGDAGFCLDPDDTRKLAQTMRDLTTNAALRAELVQKGLARAKKFSWETCADIVADTVAAAVEEKRRTAPPVAAKEGMRPEESPPPAYAAVFRSLKRMEIPLLGARALVPLGVGLAASAVGLWFLLKGFPWALFGLGCAVGACALFFAALVCKKIRNGYTG